MAVRTLIVAIVVAFAAQAAAFAAARAPALARSAMMREPRARIAASEDGKSEPTPAVAPLPPSAVTPAGVPPPQAAAGPQLDVRLLPYVLVPLFVLASQLFLTFSRDTLPVDMLGAADMTK
jgi:hypothetical protein